MCESILLIIAMLEVDEDAQIVCSRNDPDAGAGELGAQLIEPARRDAFNGTVYPKCRHGRMM